jgi:hypothetical protein
LRNFADHFGHDTANRFFRRRDATDLIAKIIHVGFLIGHHDLTLLRRKLHILDLIQDGGILRYGSIGVLSLRRVEEAELGSRKLNAREHPNTKRNTGGFSIHHSRPPNSFAHLAARNAKPLSGAFFINQTLP